MMEWLVILVSGAPNASYDVELILTNYKNLSVYKRYFMPFQGKLPVIPQVTSKCIFGMSLTYMCITNFSPTQNMYGTLN